MNSALNQDKVVCCICNKEMPADKFAEHAINMHEAEVLDLISDDYIIERLSDWGT